MNFARNILDFNNQLQLELNGLTDEIQVLNPFKGDGSKTIERISKSFYNKFYSDDNKRKLILGINPGRLGAGSTGIPFTDTKRLKQCGIEVDFELHEPSSVYVYKVIDAFGGAEKFYEDFYISSVCPLGFVKRNDKGNWVNYNYYDDLKLQKLVEPFILKSLIQQIKFGLDTSKIYCLGTGKNFKFLNKFNKEHKLFGEIIPLEHPRYIMQYKSKNQDLYVDKFLRLLSE